MSRPTLLIALSLALATGPLLADETTVLRERMTHVLPVRSRPDLFPLRRKIVACLRQRDADGAAASLDELINKLRE